MRTLNPKTYSLTKAENELEAINIVIVKKSEEIMTFEALKDKCTQKIYEVAARKLYIKSILLKKKKLTKMNFRKREKIKRLLNL